MTKSQAPQMDRDRAFSHADRYAVESRMAGLLAIQTAKDARKMESRHITWGIHAYESAAKQRDLAALAAVYTLIGLLEQ